MMGKPVLWLSFSFIEQVPGDIVEEVSSRASKEGANTK
jgi:hypothetical protein